MIIAEMRTYNGKKVCNLPLVTNHSIQKTSACICEISGKPLAEFSCRFRMITADKN
jgi:hypothetical protein